LIQIFCYLFRIYLVSIGVHMGSSQVLPAFLANLSSFLAPVFFMVVSPLLLQKLFFVPVAYGAGGTNILFIGVLMGSFQFRLAFFANLSLSLAPVFLMIFAS